MAIIFFSRRNQKHQQHHACVCGLLCAVEILVQLGFYKLSHGQAGIHLLLGNTLMPLGNVDHQAKLQIVLLN